MEGVEDIPGSALNVGLPWNWNFYTEYLDTLSRRSFSFDIASQIPHSAVRAYVLKQRAETDEPATADEVGQIMSIVQDGIRAGAIGVGTSASSCIAARMVGSFPTPTPPRPSSRCHYLRRRGSRTGPCWAARRSQRDRLRAAVTRPASPRRRPSVGRAALPAGRGRICPHDRQRHRCASP